MHLGRNKVGPLTIIHNNDEINKSITKGVWLP